MNAKVSSSLGNWVVVAMEMAVHCDGTAGVDVFCRVSPWLLRLELTSPGNAFPGWSPIILSRVPCPSLHPRTSLQNLNNSALIILGRDFLPLGNLFISSVPVVPMEAKFPQGKIRFRLAFSILNDTFSDKPSGINSFVLSVHSVVPAFVMAHRKPV